MARTGRVHGVIIAAMTALTLGLVALPAGAQAPTPGLLTTSDLPAGYTQPSDARTFTQFSLPVTNPSTCTETPTAVSGIANAMLVTFSPPGGATNTSGLAESVLTFPDAKSAKAAYAARVKSDKARWKCASVGFVPVSQSAAIATLNYGKAKAPKIGRASFATSGSAVANATSPSITVTFVSGPYLVLVQFASAPSATDEQSILKAALRHLG